MEGGGWPRTSSHYRMKIFSKINHQKMKRRNHSQNWRKRNPFMAEREQAMNKLRLKSDVPARLWPEEVIYLAMLARRLNLQVARAKREIDTQYKSGKLKAERPLFVKGLGEILLSKKFEVFAKKQADILAEVQECKDLFQTSRGIMEGFPDRVPPSIVRSIISAYTEHLQNLKLMENRLLELREKFNKRKS